MDLICRLRNLTSDDGTIVIASTASEAADEIERLRAENKELRDRCDISPVAGPLAEDA